MPTINQIVTIANGRFKKKSRRKGITKAVGHSVRKCFFFTIPLQYMLRFAKQQTDLVTFKINLYLLLVLIF